jgi:GntR family transcriptional regulator, galactonate operon transcriptional repressor
MGVSLREAISASGFAPRRIAARGPVEGPFAQITESLAVAIISGRLPVGALVPSADAPEGEVTASRTAYREAMRFLAGKGLIEARQRSGTRVAPREGWHLLDPDVLKWSLSAQPDETFVRDLFELRMMIEPGATRLAALRHDAAQLGAIRLALEGMQKETPYTEDAFSADLAFHEAIFRAAGNAAVEALTGVVSTTLQWSLRTQNRRPAADFAIPLSDHVRLYEAIERRDGDEASTLSRILVADALRSTLAAFRGTRFALPDSANPYPRIK